MLFVASLLWPQIKPIILATFCALENIVSIGSLHSLPHIRLQHTETNVMTQSKAP